MLPQAVINPKHHNSNCILATLKEKVIKHNNLIRILNNEIGNLNKINLLVSPKSLRSIDCLLNCFDANSALTINLIQGLTDLRCTIAEENQIRIEQKRQMELLEMKKKKEERKKKVYDDENEEVFFVNTKRSMKYFENESEKKKSRIEDSKLEKDTEEENEAKEENEEDEEVEGNKLNKENEEEEELLDMVVSVKEYQLVDDIVTTTSTSTPTASPIQSVSSIASNNFYSTNKNMLCPLYHLIRKTLEDINRSFNSSNFNSGFKKLFSNHNISGFYCNTEKEPKQSGFSINRDEDFIFYIEFESPKNHEDEEDVIKMNLKKENNIVKFLPSLFYLKIYYKQKKVILLNNLQQDLEYLEEYKNNKNDPNRSKEEAEKFFLKNYFVFFPCLYHYEDIEKRYNEIYIMKSNKIEENFDTEKNDDDKDFEKKSDDEDDFSNFNSISYVQNEDPSQIYLYEKLFLIEFFYSIKEDILETNDLVSEYSQSKNKEASDEEVSVADGEYMDEEVVDENTTENDTKEMQIEEVIEIVDDKEDDDNKNDSNIPEMKNSSDSLNMKKDDNFVESSIPTSSNYPSVINSKLSLKLQRKKEASPTSPILSNSSQSSTLESNVIIIKKKPVNNVDKIDKIIKNDKIDKNDKNLANYLNILKKNFYRSNFYFFFLIKRLKIFSLKSTINFIYTTLLNSFNKKYLVSLRTISVWKNNLKCKNFIKNKLFYANLFKFFNNIVAKLFKKNQFNDSNLHYNELHALKLNYLRKNFPLIFIKSINLFSKIDPRTYSIVIFYYNNKNYRIPLLDFIFANLEYK